MEAWVGGLPEKEARSLLARVLNGEGLKVHTELQSRYHRRADAENPQGHAGPRRTAAELLTMAALAEQERKQREKAEKDRKRNAHLKGLVPRLPELWATVHRLTEEQKASSYEQACTLLVEMRDAYAYAERRPELDAEFARYLGKFSRSTALVRRFKSARLMS